MFVRSSLLELKVVDSPLDDVYGVRHIIQQQAPQQPLPACLTSPAR
jgi:hypothetical protein